MSCSLALVHPTITYVNEYVNEVCCMCFDCSVEGAGCGRQESCVQEKLFDGVPSALGEFGKVCAVILPGTMALGSCKSIRPQAEAQRSSLEEPEGHSPHGWSTAV